MKQQLQREQLQELERQEIERRENERKNSMIIHNTAPNQTIAQHKTAFPDDIQQLRSQYGSANLFMPSPSASSSTVQSADQYTIQQEQTQIQQNQAQNVPNAPLKLPLHIDVDLPSQVLKVSIKKFYFTHLFYLFKLIVDFALYFIFLTGTNRSRKSNSISRHSKTKKPSTTIFK